VHGGDGYAHPAKWVLMKPAVVQGVDGEPTTQDGSVELCGNGPVEMMK
jgi:hypothetical protein